MLKSAIAVMLVALLSCSAFAQEDDKSDDATDAVKQCPALQASTIFVKDKGQKGSAEKLTQSHKNAESQGWSFSHMSLYIENGDLQGFFVTYTRPHPCNNK